MGGGGDQQQHGDGGEKKTHHHLWGLDLFFFTALGPFNDASVGELGFNTAPRRTAAVADGP